MMNTQRLILQDLESSASARLSTELESLRMRMTGEQAAALSAAKQEAVKHLAAEHERATAELTSTVAGLREDHALELAESRESESEQIAALEGYGRPILCTEYMARPLRNTFADILPLFTEHQIGAYQWGFVNGRSQTIYPWWSWAVPEPMEPDPWFHDLLRADGTPYDPAEIVIIQRALSGG